MSFQSTDFFVLDEFTHKGLFASCAHVWDALKHLEEYLKSQTLGKIEVDIPERVTLVNPESISIGHGTQVEPGAYIKGPCIIGRDCQIRQGAYMRGFVIVGDHSVIGHTTEIKSSIVLNHANAAHFAYMGNTILGNHTNLGAGVKCANLRLDRAEIVIKSSEVYLATGMRKFGAIIGDGVQIGCNTVVNPGTIIGKETHIFPSMVVGGIISANSVAFEERIVRIRTRRLSGKAV